MSIKYRYSLQGSQRDSAQEKSQFMLNRYQQPTQMHVAMPGFKTWFDDSTKNSPVCSLVYILPLTNIFKRGYFVEFANHPKPLVV